MHHRSTLWRPLLASLVTALLVAGFTVPSSAADKKDLEREKRAVGGKIDSAQENYDQSSAAYQKAAKALQSAEAQLNEAEAELGRTRGQLAAAQAEDARMQAELDEAEAKLAAAIAELEQGEADLQASADEVAAFTVESMTEGDRGMRAFGELLNGESPSMFIENMSLNESVSDAQVARMQKLEAARVMLSLKRDKVEELRDQVAVAREEAAANLRTMEALEAAAAQQAAEVGELVQAREAASSKAAAVRAKDAKTLAAYEAERNRLNAQLAELARKEKERAARQNSGGGSSGGGSSSGGDSGGTLSSPIPGAYITSSYGMRVHPVTGVYKLHDGTDFGAGCGTPIRAAASGTIIQQYYNAGYGNRVILNNGIKRGKSVVTTYNHLSSFARSTGSRVSRGEIIGYVGSTGYSTGCHLHWMVIADGRTTNPVGWL